MCCNLEYRKISQKPNENFVVGYTFKLCENDTSIDYFPTNFVVHNEEIYYVDFECNDYMEEWNFENWGVKYWSKTPEFLQYVKEHS